MYDAEAIEKFISLSDNYELDEQDDVLMHSNHAGTKVVKFPKVDTFKCFSLTQLMTFLEVAEFQSDATLCVNVKSYNEVEIFLPELNKNKDWDIVAESDFSQVVEVFKPGKHLDQEDFIINLMTKFERTDEMKNLLSLVSSIKEEKLSTSEDDGFSQVAHTKGGVHLAVAEKIKNLWTLKTYKTFPEIEQPAITYILRLHQHRDDMPSFSLHDCDGGQWRVQTTIAIRTWIQKYVEDNKSKLEDKVIVL